MQGWHMLLSNSSQMTLSAAGDSHGPHDQC